MTHVTPFVLQAGRGVQGSSLGYHAYSLRVDNLSNQWLQEESTLVWIPPYSLGVVVRLWGTSVALVIPSAPVGQAQLAPIAGEYAVAVFSDEMRAENPGVPVRQFTLVQAVSDLTEGAQPALPPVSVDRLYADTSGNIHHLHSDGTDLTLVDPSNAGTLLYPSFDPHYQALINAAIAAQVPGIVNGSALGADLYGTVAAGHVGVRNGSAIYAYDAGGASHMVMQVWTDNFIYINSLSATTGFVFRNGGNATLATLDASGNFNSYGVLAAGPIISGTAGDVSANRGNGTGYLWFVNNTHYIGFDGASYQLPTSNLNVVSLTIQGAANSWGALLAFPQATGRKISLYDAGGAGFYGLGINPGEIYLTVPGGVFNVRAANETGAQLFKVELNGNITSYGNTLNFYNGGNSQLWQCTSAAVMSASWTVNAPGGYTQVSNEDVKGSIVVIPADQWTALLHNDELRGLSYERLDAPKAAYPEPPLEYGFSANKWLPYLPELVTTNEKGVATAMSYNGIIPFLWESVRSLLTRVEALESNARA